MNFIEFNGDNWKDEVIKTDKPVLVDFRLPGAGSQVVEDLLLGKLQDQWGDQLRIGIVDARKNPEIAQSYNINDFSTLTLFLEGEPQYTCWGSGRVRRMIGFWLSPLKAKLEKAWN